MTSALDAVVVTEPGVYEMSSQNYHADPVPGQSLSCSGAKKLLDPSCPALFDWERRNPPPPKDVFDIGHAAHKLALGIGPDIVVVPGDRWDTKDAKQRVAEVRAAGNVPVKADAMEQLTAMAEALRAHPIAKALLSDGQPEASAFWVDEPTGIWRRCRFDWLPNPSSSGRLIVPDYKTAASAHPKKWIKSAADYGYEMQAAWYLDAVKALGLADDAAFVFLVQEKTPPYLVSTVQLDVVALRIGRHRNREAIDTYAQCTAENRWPGYAEDVELVSLPRWVEREYEDVI